MLFKSAFNDKLTIILQGRVMIKKDKEFFKEYLSERLEDLLNQAGSTVSGMTETKENFPDPTDRAALEAERNFMLRIRDREAKLIKKNQIGPGTD